MQKKQMPVPKLFLAFSEKEGTRHTKNQAIRKRTMGRPPCCDKEGVKKGPWTPEEDIILVSYIQEHGPANWRAVPTNTGLLRCSKSCRLRWTNYLRPGIKRGNFTEQEEKTIVHLQALLGNRWAAIASYLPQRTDNDVKNYWNTHLRKKLKKLEVGSSKCHFEDGSSSSPHSMSRGQWERRLQTNIDMAKRALSEALSVQTNSSLSEMKPPDVSLSTSSKSLQTSSTYAASADNIARLLKGWMGNSSNPGGATAKSSATTQNSFNNMPSWTDTSSSDQGTPSAANRSEFGLSDNFESLLESLDSSTSEFSQSLSPEPALFQNESKPNVGDHDMQLSFIEKWLFDESTSQEKISYSMIP